MTRAIRLLLPFALSLAIVPPAIAAPATELTAHRAVYDLTLSFSRGKRPIEAVRGRILYDFTGNSCEGYALQFRQVSEIEAGEGKTLMSDLRAATFEDGDAKTFRFTSQNFINDNLVDSVDGTAERKSAGVGVALKKPGQKKLDLENAIVFPTEHMRRIIEAARDNKTIIELPVFDGSETGEKVYNTLAVIGKEIGASDKPDDAAAGAAVLAGMKRWPVTISYFDRSKKESGEPLPVYSIGFELYENGVSRKLSLDYNDFVIVGKMSQLDIKPAAACAK